MITKRLDHGEHFVVSNKTPAVHQFILVDGCGQFAGFVGKLAVGVGKLPPLHTGRHSDGVLPAIDKRPFRSEGIQADTRHWLLLYCG